MRRLVKIVAIMIVLLVAGTYSVYALDYKGNYNLDASVQVNIIEFTSQTLTEFSYDVESTSPVQFWNLFRGSEGEGGSGHGHKPQPGEYKVMWELDRVGSSGVRTYFYVDLVENGETKVFKAHFDNEPPGQANLKVTLMNYLGTPLLIENYDVVIG